MSEAAIVAYYRRKLAKATSAECCWVAYELLGALASICDEERWKGQDKPLFVDGPGDSLKYDEEYRKQGEGETK